MSRLLPFLLGALAGGAGVFFWLGTGFESAGSHANRAPTARDPGIARVAVAAVASLPKRLIARAPNVAEPNDVAEPDQAASIAAASMVAATISPGALLVPVLGVAPGQLTDSYTQSRGAGRSHDAIDIMAARGTPVVAVDDGKVARLFNSKPGGLTLYQFDRQEKMAYYYAHLDSYAPGIVEGQELKRGELLGYVGSTGNANPDAPHLHFAIFVLGPEKYWWRGTAINPYSLLGGRSVQAP